MHQPQHPQLRNPTWQELEHLILLDHETFPSLPQKISDPLERAPSPNEERRRIV